MWKVIGVIAGLLLGLALDEKVAAIGFALFGALIGWAKDSHDARRAAGSASAAPPVAEDALRAVHARLEALEARLARLERATGGPIVAEPPPPVPAAPADAGEPAVVAPAPHGDAAPPRDDATTPPPRPAYGVASAPATARAAERPAASPSAPGALDAVRAWLAGGNALTRVGIVVLFFGVAFLLRYFAEIANVPIEAKLAAAGAGGLALAALGLRLARARPGYGLSLQGAGMGVVYLTVFAAFRLYEALPPLPAIALLVIVAAATIGLALRHDAQALAALAFAGGFMAPVLIDTGTDAPALLFGWFAVLNAGVFAVAWRRAWRALNVLGFAFTFALGLAWGWTFYRPAHYATVQPFLVLYFLFYVGIAILYAKRQPLDATAPVDGVLVFGVPLVGFALQAGIARDFRHGEAWSAVALAAFYALLWLVLRARAESGLARLAKAFAALAVVFGTLAIPFALDARWTSAGWAIEAAAVYWLGVVQRQRFARAFALAVLVAGALAFVWGMPYRGGAFLANPAFVGMALIGLAGFAIAFVADRHADVLGERERRLAGWVFAWGAAWWLAAGYREIARVYANAREVNVTLAWIAGTGAVGLAIARSLRWTRAGWLFVVVLPALAVGGVALFDVQRSTLPAFGFVAWPLAWLVHVAGLRFADARTAHGPPMAAARVRDLHVAGAVAFVAWLAWEASEWTGRASEEGTVWIACAAALPAIAYLALVARSEPAPRWPLAAHAEPYGRRAGALLAIMLAAWFAGVNLVSPGDPHPLPYLPVANPLDATLLAALAALWRWSGAWSRAPARRRVALAGAGAFVALNGVLARTAHHWGDVPWQASALFAYRPLQVAVTLAWTVCALALMLAATRRGLREGWLAGAALLAAVLAKLFLVDLEALSGLTRVIAFLGVGVLLLVIGYVAPLPPSRDAGRST